MVGQYDGDTFVPKIKMSDNAEKISNPGMKNVLRIYDKDHGKMKADIIVLEGETIDTSKDLHLVSDNAPWRSRVIPGGTFVVRKMWVQRSAKLSALREKILKEESAHFF